MLGGVGAGGKLTFHGGDREHVGVGNERADIALEQHQPLVNLVLIGGLIHVHRQVAIGDAGNVGDERGQPLLDTVDGVFHALMIAVAFDLHLLAQIAAADQAQNAVALGDGQQNGVEHCVDAVDHSGEIAFQFASLAAFVELSGSRCLGKPHEFCGDRLQIGAQRFDGVVDEGLFAGEFFKLCIEIALSELADAGHGLLLHRDVAGHHGVDALGHASEIAWVSGGVDRHIDIALVVRIGHRVHVGDDGLQIMAQRFNCIVDEGLLAWELFEFGFEIAFADLGDAGHGLLLHRDVAGHHGVDARSHPAEIAGIFSGVDRRVDVAPVVRGRHCVHVADQAVHGAGEAVDGLERLRPFSGETGGVGALIELACLQG